MWTDLLVVAVGYLLGSIPFAYLVTRALTGKDIRYEGEGNVGSRNVMHVVGRGPGFLVLALDAAKGAAAYWVGHRFGSGDMALYLTGFAMMFGHGFPVWLRWRGGKGLAAAAGFLLQMWPYSVLGAAAVLVIARMFIPDFNLAFTVAGVAMPLFSFLEGNNLRGLLFIVFLLGIAGLKKVIDLPHERAIRAKSGWFEGLDHVRERRNQRAKRG